MRKIAITPKIYVIDHAKMAIYYSNSDNQYSSDNLPLAHAIGNLEPNRYFVYSSIKTSPSNTNELNQAINAGYSIYYVNISEVILIPAVHVHPEANEVVVTAQYRLLERQEMTMGEFVKLAIDDKIPVKVSDHGGFSNSEGRGMTLIDEEKTHCYQCRILGTEKFTISAFAKLFKKQPNLISRLMIYADLHEKFEDISYHDLKRLLANQLEDFMAKMDEKAPTLIREFAKEYLVKCSADYYIDLTELAARNNADTDFLSSLTINDECIEGEWDEAKFNLISPKNPQIMALSKSILGLFNQPEAANAACQQLRDMIIQTYYDGKITSSNIYPLPRAGKWPQQDLVVTTLKFLENAAYITAKYKVHFASLELHPETIKYLLSFKVKLRTYGCDFPQHLALPRDHDHLMWRYSLELPDGSSLEWSSVLAQYIEHYNIMPSRSFLSKLAQCQVMFERHYHAVILLVAELDSLPLIRKCLEILPDVILERLHNETYTLEISERHKKVIHDAISLELAHRTNESIAEQSLAQFRQMPENIKNDLVASLGSILELTASIEHTSICYQQAQMLRANVLSRLVNQAELSQIICRGLEEELTQLALMNSLSSQDNIKVLIGMAYAGAGIDGKLLMAKMMGEILSQKATLAAENTELKNQNDNRARSSNSYPKSFIEEMRNGEKRPNISLPIATNMPIEPQQGSTVIKPK